MSTPHHDDDDGKKVRVVNDSVDNGFGDGDEVVRRDMERRLVRKIDLRLCTIAGILCSLNLLDSGIISSASVTTIFEDLGLGVGNRYVSFEFLILCWLRRQRMDCLCYVMGTFGWI